jgi:hypothetical protein
MNSLISFIKSHTKNKGKHQPDKLANVEIR